MVVLHGGPGLSEYTESLLPELVNRYTVVRFQQRGLAPSTVDGPFDVETQMADTLAVLDRLGLTRAILLGHSWGGHLAMHLVAAHPDRVAAALLVDPLGAVGDGGEADLGRLLGDRVSPEAAARAAELGQKGMRGEGSEADQLQSLSLIWPGYFSDPASAPPMPKLEMSIAAYSGTFTSIHEHFERQTLASLLPKSTVPTLFLLGADSPIPPAHGIASAELMPSSEVKVLAACGHFPWLEQPGSVRAALDSLTSRIPQPNF